MDRHAVACLLVGLVIALDSKHRVDAVICPTLQPQTFTRCQAADATLAQNAGRSFVAMRCMGAVAYRWRSVLRARSDLMGFFRANFNSALLAARCKGMRNFFANPPAPTVDCGVTQVDAVTDLCHLVAGLGRALDRHSNLIQPGFATEPARIGSQRTA